MSPGQPRSPADGTTRRGFLAAGGAAGLTALAGCSGSLMGTAGGTTTVYGSWTPAEVGGADADDAGDACVGMYPSKLDDARHSLGNLYAPIRTFLSPPVPDYDFGELAKAYVNTGWTSTLYGVEGDFAREDMVAAFESGDDTTTLDAEYEGYALLRRDTLAGSYLLGVAEGRIAYAESGDYDRAALEALIDAREGSNRRATGDGAFGTLADELGEGSFTSVSVGRPVSVDVQGATPTAFGGKFSVASSADDTLDLTNALLMPDSVSDPRASVESHLESQGRLGLWTYDDPAVEMAGEVVLVTETRAATDAITFR